MWQAKTEHVFLFQFAFWVFFESSLGHYYFFLEDFVFLEEEVLWTQCRISCKHFFDKVENILKGSLDWIPSPSPSDLRPKSLLTTPRNVLPLHLKQTFTPIIWIFTEGDGIEFRLPFKIFSTLKPEKYIIKKGV